MKSKFSDISKLSNMSKISNIPKISNTSKVPIKSIKIFALIIKNNILTIFFTLFLIFLVTFSQTNLFAAKNGLTLWAKNVVPSLFPFFIATELLNYTSIPYYIGKLTNRFMRPLFNVPR